MQWYRQALSLLRRDRELRRLAMKPTWISILVFILVLFLVGNMIVGVIVSMFYHL